ncbi:MAG: hypothetical protein FWC38_03250, partial [Proteobacteria bacterium]|nr:hypothetical protein [Pseudomonadota bacterium]
MKRFLRTFLTALTIAAMSLSASAATININAPGDWPASGTITLSNNDVLNIAATAGSPTNPTAIHIAADANVTINGSGSMVNNLRIQDAWDDSTTHAVIIRNLKISSQNNGYTRNMGVLHLEGDNEIAHVSANPTVVGSNGSGITAGDVFTITSSSGGKLKVSSNARYGFGLFVRETLNIEGNADVTASHEDTGALTLQSDSNTLKSLKVAPNARLTAKTIFTNRNFEIICDGTMNVNGSLIARDILNNIYQSISIRGNGTLTVKGNVWASAFSVDGTDVSISAPSTAGGLSNEEMLKNNGFPALSAINGATLTNAASLALKGAPAYEGAGFTVGADTVVTIINTGSAPETHTFTMASTGSQWQLDNATAPSGAPTSATLQVSFAPGQEGIVSLNDPGTATPTITTPAGALAAGVVGRP